MIVSKKLNLETYQFWYEVGDQQVHWKFTFLCNTYIGYGKGSKEKWNYFKFDCRHAFEQANHWQILLTGQMEVLLFWDIIHYIQYTS